MNPEMSFYGPLLVVALSMVLGLCSFSRKFELWHAATLLMSCVFLSHAGSILGVMYPIRDSLTNHFTSFRYVADFIKNSGDLPEWYAANGGIRLGYSVMSVGTFLPHHLVGYVMYATGFFNEYQSYFFSWATGVYLNSLGMLVLVWRSLHSKPAACFAALTYSLCGASITYHQEQVLFTMAAAPWAMWFLVEMRRDGRWVLPLAGILGFASFLHFPQIQFIGMFLIGLALLLAYRRQAIEVVRHIRMKYAALGLLLFIFTAAPAPYISASISELIVPQRIAEGIAEGSGSTARTFKEFAALQDASNASARDQYMKQYYKRGQPTSDDMATFYVGRTALMLFVLSPLLAFRIALPLIALTGILSLIMMGVFSRFRIIDYLYYLSPWLMGTFRQWLHFVPFHQGTIIAVAAVSVAAALRTNHLGSSSRIIPVISLRNGIVLVLVLVVVSTIDLLNYRDSYLNRFIVKAGPGNYPPARDVVRPDMRLVSDVGYVMLKWRTFLCEPYRAHTEPYTIAPRLEPFFPTTYFFHSPDKVANLFDSTDKIGLDKIGSVCLLQKWKGPRAIFLPEGVEGLVPEIRQNAESKISERILYSGYEYKVETMAPSLLVTAVNHKLNVAVKVNGTSVAAPLVANGGLVAVVVPAGRSIVQLTPVMDYFTFAIRMHLFGMLLLLLSVVYLIKTNGDVTLENRHRLKLAPISKSL